MRVLFVTRTYPYPARAGDLRYSAELIEAMAAHPQIELTVFCGSEYAAPPDESGAEWTGRRAESGRGADICAAVGRLPRAACRAMGAGARRELEALLRRTRFDIALLNEGVTAPALNVLERHNLPAIYVSHNVDADVRPAVADAVRAPAKRAVQRWDAAKYKHLEQDLLCRVIGLTAITAEDQARYRELAPDVPSAVVRPGYRAESRGPIAPMAERKPIAVLVGSFEWGAKVANLDEILAAHRACIATNGPSPFTLRIAGQARPGLFERLSRAHTQVEFVPSFNRLADVVADARLALVLEKMGGGFKLKTLDYIFSDLAIVAYPHAMAGAGLVAGEDYFAVDTADEAMREIARLAGATELLGARTKSARAKADHAYDWADRADVMAEFLAQLMARLR